MDNLYKTVLFSIIGYIVLIVIIVSMRICISGQNKDIMYLKHRIIELESYQKVDSIMQEMNRQHDMEYQIMEIYNR